MKEWVSTEEARNSFIRKCSGCSVAQQLQLLFGWLLAWELTCATGMAKKKKKNWSVLIKWGKCNSTAKGMIQSEYLWFVNKTIHPPFIFFFFCFLGHMKVPRLGDQIRAAAAVLHHSHKQCGIWATCPTGNTRSLIHWASAGIKPRSSWIPVGLVITEPQRECPPTIFTLVVICCYVKLKVATLDPLIL